MKASAWFAPVVAWGIFAAAVFAEEPTAPAAPAVPESVALLPKECIAFIHLPNLKALDDDLARLARETGITIGKGDHPVRDILAGRTGIEMGLDPAGSVTVGFLDPKKFRDRYTVYVLPVADWDAMLKGTLGEETSPGIYALTGTAGPRFVLRRGKYAVITSSIRTMDAITRSTSLAETLTPESLARASGPAPMVYLDLHRITTIYEDEITSWFRAASGQLYNRPDAVAYADMLVTYMLGIADFIDQIETIEGSVQPGADGIAADLAVRFVQGASIANLLAAQVSGAAPVTLPPDRQIVSATTIGINPKCRTDMIMAAVTFFLDKAPRPEPLPEPTKEQVNQAVRMFAESLGPNMTFISAPAAAGFGTAAELTILDLKDPAQFQKSVGMLVASWEALADQLNLYVRFQPVPDAGEVAGLPIVEYVPRFRFGIPARHLEFRERLRQLYGPEGLVYRIVVVGDKAVIATGSDLGLFRETVERLKAGKTQEQTEALKQLQGRLPREQQVSVVLNLPEFFAQALLRGGTPPERVGTINPGREIAGLTLTASGTTVRMSSFWPYEQIRLTRTLLQKAAPELLNVPESLFEPTKEGPPMPAPEPAPAPAPSNAPAK